MTVGEALERVRQLAGQEDLEARLTLAAAVTKILSEDDIRPVVVGGTAVDVYASGQLGTSESYPPGWRESLDLDTVVLRTSGGPARQQAQERLEETGFEPSPAARTFVIDDVPYPVDLVGDELPPDYSENHLRSLRYDLWSGLGLPAVRLAGAEDVLFDYMESGVSMRHQRDWTRALAIAQAMGEDLDLGYLFSKAEWRRGGEFVSALEELLRGEPLEDAD